MKILAYSEKKGGFTVKFFDIFSTIFLIILSEMVGIYRNMKKQLSLEGSREGKPNQTAFFRGGKPMWERFKDNQITRV